MLAAPAWMTEPLIVKAVMMESKLSSNLMVNSTARFDMGLEKEVTVELMSDSLLALRRRACSLLKWVRTPICFPMSKVPPKSTRLGGAAAGAAKNPSTRLDREQGDLLSGCLCEGVVEQALLLKLLLLLLLRSLSEGQVLEQLKSQAPWSWP